MMAFAPVRSDTLPENSTYRDDGCDVSPSCLNCPLPVCKFDDPDYLRRSARNARDQAIIETRRREKLSVPALAQMFGVSTRTVHRVLQSDRLGSFRPVDAVPALRMVSGVPTRSFRPPPPLPEIWPAASIYRVERGGRPARVREVLSLQGAA
jgi:hypothetical protein